MASTFNLQISVELHDSFMAQLNFDHITSEQQGDERSFEDQGQEENNDTSNNTYEHIQPTTENDLNTTYKSLTDHVPESNEATSEDCVEANNSETEEYFEPQLDFGVRPYNNAPNTSDIQCNEATDSHISEDFVYNVINETAEYADVTSETPYQCTYDAYSNPQGPCSRKKVAAAAVCIIIFLLGTAVMCTVLFATLPRSRQPGNTSSSSSNHVSDTRFLFEAFLAEVTSLFHENGNEQNSTPIKFDVITINTESSFTSSSIFTPKRSGYYWFSVTAALNNSELFLTLMHSKQANAIDGKSKSTTRLTALFYLNTIGNLTRADSCSFVHNNAIAYVKDGEQIYVTTRQSISNPLIIARPISFFGFRLDDTISPFIASTFSADFATKERVISVFNGAAEPNIDRKRFEVISLDFSEFKFEVTVTGIYWISISQQCIATDTIAYCGILVEKNVGKNPIGLLNIFTHGQSRQQIIFVSGTYLLNLTAEDIVTTRSNIYYMKTKAQHLSALFLLYSPQSNVTSRAWALHYVDNKYRSDHHFGVNSSYAHQNGTITIGEGGIYYVSLTVTFACSKPCSFMVVLDDTRGILELAQETPFFTGLNLCRTVLVSLTTNSTLCVKSSDDIHERTQLYFVGVLLHPSLLSTQTL